MSIAQTLESQKQLGENQGYWAYRDIDGNIFAYAIRTISNGRKEVKPWTIKNNRLRLGGLGSSKPIYNLHLLKLHPEKKNLWVEGEKTAEAAEKLFPEFNVFTILGGYSSFSKGDYSLFKGSINYLLPDNDDKGYEGMDSLCDCLKKLDCRIYYVDIKKLTSVNKWDVADLNDDHGDLDQEEVRDFVLSTKESKEEFCYPEMSSGKKPYPLDVTENLKYLLNYNNIVVKWNMMKRAREVIYPGKTFYNEEADNESLTIITNLAVKFGFNIRRIDKHLDAISFENRFHPVRDWILSESVSDISIFDKFLRLLKTTNDELSRLIMLRWLISAIAVFFNESDFCAQGVLVIQGEGGWRKTTFLASLLPPELNAVYKGAALDPSNKDCLITMSKYAIAELGELGATFKKADINKLKAFITKDSDDVRRPFAAKNSLMLRRTIFAATVNEGQFLVDETGNRRWLVISLSEAINIEHGLNMQQVWRCAYDLWVSGERDYFDANELKLLNASNEEYETSDPYFEKIMTRFDFDEQPTKWMPATLILESIGYQNISRSDATKMGITLKKMKIKSKRCNSCTLYYMPILKLEYR